MTKQPPSRNPKALFPGFAELVGPAGSGKTHLLTDLASDHRLAKPSAKVLQCAAADLVHQMVIKVLRLGP